MSRARPDLRDLALLLIPAPPPEAAERMAAATVEVHEIVAALHLLAARIARLEAIGSSRRSTTYRDIPDGLAEWTPGECLSLPADLGGDTVETGAESRFWAELGLDDYAESLAETGREISSFLAGADRRHGVEAAEEAIKRLPPNMLEALRAAVEVKRGEVRP